MFGLMRMWVDGGRVGEWHCELVENCGRAFLGGFGDVGRGRDGVLARVWVVVCVLLRGKGVGVGVSVSWLVLVVAVGLVGEFLRLWWVLNDL